ncbi:MAG: efflux RND transporter permease subunit [Clostridia bacterium]|nr:efflux RND transporter permease subunit [Clostridia bacterium]
MNLSRFSVRRPITALMMTFVIILLGVVALTNLKMDLFPDINLPYAIVSTSYSGAGPEEVENIVTRTIETAMATVSNIKTISSTSGDGSSLVILEFNQDTDMDVVMLEMRERLDMVSPYLPDDVSSPMLIKFDMNLIPMMGYSVSYDDSDMWATTRWAEDVLKPRLEKIDGVASVSITGGIEKEIRITPDKAKMESLGITEQMLGQMITAGNLNLPGGKITDGSTEYSVRTLGAFQSLDDLKAVSFFSKTLMKPVELKDFAEVTYDNINTRTYSRVNGRDSITISLQKQSDYNTVEVAGRVRDEISLIEEEYAGASLVLTLDQSQYTRMMVNNVGLNGLIGAILAVIILFVFLKDIRATFIIGVAIPISILAAFILIYFAGITLNIVSMGGLALGIGMLVDNSIVVIENIYRLRTQGLGMKKAAIKGASTIAGAITASTLTTVSVFLPVVFISGFTADIFREMALTVSISLLASLFIALTLVPMIASKTLRADKSKHHHVISALTRFYSGALGWSLKRRALVLVIALLFFGGSVYGVLGMGMEYFPESDQGQLSVSVELPKGSEYTETVAIVSEIEEILQSYEEVKITSASVLSKGGAFGFGGSGGGADTGTLTVVLVPKSDRSMSTAEFADDLRNRLKEIEGANIFVSAIDNPGMAMLGGSSVTVEIQGDDLMELDAIAEDIKKIFDETEGISESETSLDSSAPEIAILPVEPRMAMAGITTYQIANAVSNSLQGLGVTSVRLDNNDVTVRIMRPDEFVLDTIGDISIPTALGTEVSLKDVAVVEIREGVTSIQRESQQRLASVTGKLSEGYDPGSVGRAIQDRLDDYEYDDSYTIKLAGTNEEIAEAFDSLLFALAIGIILVYMIMAAQFESLIHPFIIMFSIPLAFTGAFLGLLSTGNPLSVPAFIGMIVLAGIVVNNGIVLVDYINRLRREGRRKDDAILEAGPVRLRPILMTVVTTILALVPMSIGLGEGTEMTTPLAITVIGGLIFSTILTLIVIPVMYSLIAGRDKPLKKKKKSKGGKDVVPV